MRNNSELNTVEFLVKMQEMVGGMSA